MMSVVKQLTGVLCICLISSACNSLDKEVQETIASVDPMQKKSLTAFIEYYANDKKQLKTAKFIIANLLNKQSIKGINYMAYQAYIDSIDQNWETINSPKNYDYTTQAHNLQNVHFA